jgi:hypothetical protein
MNTAIVTTDEIETLPDGSRVDNTLLLEALQRELCRRSEAFKNNQAYNPELFYSSIRRPNCGIQKQGSREFISSVNDLIEMIAQIDCVKVERSYAGQDHGQSLLLKARLPEGYFGRVAYLRYKHVPRHFKNKRLIDTISMPYRGPRTDGPLPEGEVVRVLRELQPVFTDRSCYEIPREVIEPEYNFVTFKINRETRALKNWFPGVDVNCNPCSGKEDEFILIGRHYKDYANK